MNSRLRCLCSLALVAVLTVGCSSGGGTGGTRYGETSHNTMKQSDRYATVSDLETVKVDEKYKLGIGTAVGAVAGGLLGSQIGDGTGATVAGAVLGGAAGTYAESKMGKNIAQKVSLAMDTGGKVTIVQPEDSRLRVGMKVRVEGSGENARVVPR